MSGNSFFSKYKYEINGDLVIFYFDSISRFDNVENFFDHLFDFFGYSFIFFNFRIKFVNKEIFPDLESYEKLIIKYLLFVVDHYFFWDNLSAFSFFLIRRDIISKSSIRKSIIYLFDEESNSEKWGEKSVYFKNILKKIGISDLKFFLRSKKNKYLKLDNSLMKEKEINFNNSVKLYSCNLLKKWEKRKIFEMSIHTKFSSLDGVASLDEYIVDAKNKGYGFIAITDHFNIQSFPEINKYNENDDLRIFYGCELEMIEDEFPPYIFNYKDLSGISIKNSIYCLFDIETTGLFSDIHEIIEISYIIYNFEEKRVLKEKEFFIKPEFSDIYDDSIFPHWFTEEYKKKIRNSSFSINDILPILKKDWNGLILVSHNARNFDFNFLRKKWNSFFDEEIDNIIVDTLPLSWIVFPKKKSYSLEKLSQFSKKEKIVQTHHALDDSRLLLNLFLKIIDIIENKDIFYWSDIEKEINKDYYFNFGYKVKVIVKNEEGLRNLYKLITVSHTKNLFKNPCVFRSEIINYRSGLLIGSSGSFSGEIFSNFINYEKNSEREKRLNFYDFFEINNISSFNHLLMNKKIKRREIEKIIFSMISLFKKKNKIFVCSNNVHYCNENDKIIKKILVSNEGINGRRHPLYHEILSDDKKKIFFDNLPNQHLLKKKEIIEEWLFLDNSEIIEDIIFNNHQVIMKDISNFKIISEDKIDKEKEKFLNEELKKKEKELEDFFKKKAYLLFGKNIPGFVVSRIEKEWKIIREKKYISIYWLAYKAVQKTIYDGYIVGSRGTIGASFIAFLCDITELNPLPLYKYCKECFYCEIYKIERTIITSCYNYNLEGEECPSCFKKTLSMEGNDLPFESFFGLNGEKDPDIDLNFSGKYQKIVHNYVRDLLGKDYVFRIGTISTISDQMAKLFYRNYLDVLNNNNNNC